MAFALTGDGGIDEGSFWESLNLAALLSLPVLFVVENNGYSTLTPVEARQARPDVVAKASAFGVPASSVDGNDLAAAAAAVDDAVAAMVKKYGPLYSKHQIPPGTYPGMERNVRTAGVWNILVATEDMEAAKAYAIVKTIFERKAEIATAHKEAANISLQYQTNDRSPIPYHPGAIRYFAEQGIKLR